MRIFLFLVVIASSFACLSGPNDSRDNPLDPDSPIFLPNFSQPIIGSNTSNQNFNISWITNSPSIDGFILEKSLNGDFVPLDTLNAERSFVDSSKKYSLDLFYKLKPYQFRSDGNSFRILGEKISDTLSFGGFSNAAVFNLQDSIAVQWFRQTNFDDVTKIEFKPKTETNWQELKTIPLPTQGFQRHSFLLNQNASYDFRITLFLINFEGVQEKFFERILSYN